MKIDFKAIPIAFDFAQPQPADVRKIVGNTINQSTSDIGLAEVAKRIYFSEEPTEVPGEYREEIVQIITNTKHIVAPAKIALLHALREEETE